MVFTEFTAIPSVLTTQRWNVIPGSGDTREDTGNNRGLRAIRGAKAEWKVSVLLNYIQLYYDPHMVQRANLLDVRNASKAPKHYEIEFHWRFCHLRY